MTLIESLVALLIVCLLFQLFTYLVGMSRNILRQADYHQQIEWHIFLLQLENEIAGGKEVRVEKNAIVFEELKAGEDNIWVTTFIKLANQKIKKEKNKGYQPLLMNVASWKVEEKRQEVVIQLVFTNQKQYQGSLAISKP